MIKKVKMLDGTIKYFKEKDGDLVEVEKSQNRYLPHFKEGYFYINEQLEVKFYNFTDNQIDLEVVNNNQVFRTERDRQ